MEPEHEAQHGVQVELHPQVNIVLRFAASRSLELLQTVCQYGRHGMAGADEADLVEDILSQELVVLI